MDKRTILAVVISMVILLVWARFFPPQRVPSGERKVAPARERGAEVEEVRAGARAGLKSLELDREAKRVVVTTGTSRIVLTTQGARVLEWSIKEKGNTVDLILDSLRSEGVLPLDLEIEGLPILSRAYFETEGGEVNLKEGEKKEVLFNYRLKGDLLLTKIYKFSYQGYLQGFEVRIHNQSNLPKEIGSVTLSWQAGLGTDQTLLRENTKLMKAEGMVKGTFVRRLKPDTYTGKIDWLGITNRYFIAAFIDREEHFSKAIVKSLNKHIPTFALVAPASVLASGQVKTYGVHLLVGPKEYRYLKNLDMGLERTLDFGLFGFLSIIFLSILNFFYRMTYNYGWSIVILTCILQVFTFPLTRKSFKSMEAMRSLQPKINELRVKYRTDPKRLNVEIMNLYRSRKMNPFGGCLPMLLQIPIFWALFTMLRNAVELRHSPFIFWIRDLSMKDPIYILPILMGVTMFFQQKTTASADPAQAKMAAFMPVAFTVIFLNFPSGLVLYWLVNNIITLVMQFIMQRKSKGNA